MKALALLSGGLDSRLAIRIVQQQNIEVLAVTFASVFCTCTSGGRCKLEGKAAAEDLGVPVKILNNTEQLLQIVRKPPHGYGSNMNPCIDCRILMFRRAKELLPAERADFIITGEVIGQRPMSQRREAMLLIDREAGVEGLVLRPLCAKHMPPTVPELRGWVDREKLLDIHGRSRKRQIELAKELSAGDYPCAAGGCLLTDPIFAKKMKDLLDHGDFTLNDVQLLKIGRHFRLDARTKVIVGKSEDDNEHLFSFARTGDMLFELADTTGPLALLRGELSGRHIEFAASLCARYSRLRDQASVRVKARLYGSENSTALAVRPLSPGEAASLLIAAG